jgi:hypothetical protein
VLCTDLAFCDAAHRHPTAARPWLALTAHGLMTVVAQAALHMGLVIDWAYEGQPRWWSPAPPRRNSGRSSDKLPITFLLNSFNALSMAPTAVLLQSQLIGLFVAAAVFSAVGFSGGAMKLMCGSKGATAQTGTMESYCMPAAYCIHA